jgi:hypothetical protein
MRQLSATDMLMMMLDSARTPNHMGPILICDPQRATRASLTFDEIYEGVADRLVRARC